MAMNCESCGNTRALVYCWDCGQPRICVPTFQHFGDHIRTHMHSPVCDLCSVKPALVRCFNGGGLYFCQNCFVGQAQECVVRKDHLAVVPFSGHIYCSAAPTQQLTVAAPTQQLPLLATAQTASGSVLQTSQYLPQSALSEILDNVPPFSTSHQLCSTSSMASTSGVRVVEDQTQQSTLGFGLSQNRLSFPSTSGFRPTGLQASGSQLQSSTSSMASTSVGVIRDHPQQSTLGFGLSQNRPSFPSTSGFRPTVSSSYQLASQTGLQGSGWQLQSLTSSIPSASVGVIRDHPQQSTLGFGLSQNRLSFPSTSGFRPTGLQASGSQLQSSTSSMASTSVGVIRDHPQQSTLGFGLSQNRPSFPSTSGFRPTVSSSYQLASQTGLQGSGWQLQSLTSSIPSASVGVIRDHPQQSTLGFGLSQNRLSFPSTSGFRPTGLQASGSQLQSSTSSMASTSVGVIRDHPQQSTLGFGLSQNRPSFPSTSGFRPTGLQGSGWQLQSLTSSIPSASVGVIRDHPQQSSQDPIADQSASPPRELGLFPLKPSKRQRRE
ncbi:PREDICTED: nuclear pore complex protein Nup98-Nup96-like isoform X5 [Camelina sativa]|uniref:Nuclear pore complex protein Nup98-Nup96-like isoform X5 n=1 Tax=Camelina sativa TaxID=90675 RepID=A0ABM0VE26_CAMSA|nr:PREDICTED: nuclear pore complex protein Nup98-Nup96-like isoform X5 [Camelina sativa]